METVCFEATHAGGRAASRLSIEADLYLPAGASAHQTAPVVVMAHGIGARRSFGLDRFASRFVADGMAALVFDYRHFGGSDGSPRCLVSPRRQQEDYLSAMNFVSDHEALDARRIGLWGTSFSGGHVLEVAARRPEGLQVVVSQIPFVSGWASTMAYPLKYHLPATLLGVTDRLASWLGAAPITIPVTRERGLALLASPESHAGYWAMVDKESDWPGRVPARVFLSILGYYPQRKAGSVEVPTLVVVAENDAICPPSATLKAAARLPRGRVETLPMGHFDPYDGERFEEVVSLESAFLATHLLRS